VLLVLLGLVLAAAGVRLVLYALYPFPYRAAIDAAGAASGIDPRLLAAVIRTESGFRSDASSRAQALGLMQIEPATGAWIAGQTGQAGFSSLDLMNPTVNVRMGAWYLNSLRGQLGGRMLPAVAAYNAGLQPVARWLQSGVWSGGAADAGRIPFGETRVFVERVLASYRMYRLLYPEVGGDGAGL
jgi:soluble lytic murein transglycosylase